VGELEKPLYNPSPRAHPPLKLSSRRSFSATKEPADWKVFRSFL
jgi:hypothetical protein